MASTCSTTKADVLTGGCLRARECPDKMSANGTPAASSSRKRLSHFLTQPFEEPMAAAKAACSHSGCNCHRWYKLARAAEYDRIMTDTPFRNRCVHSTDWS